VLLRAAVARERAAHRRQAAQTPAAEPTGGAL
jgi:hypothetical protein